MKMHMPVAPARQPVEAPDTMHEGEGPRAGLRHLLHVFASFGLGGVPIRISDVISALPAGFRHTIVSLDGCLDARKRVAPHVDVGFGSLTLRKRCLPCNLWEMKALIRRTAPDLLLTYNWGAIECALANRLLCGRNHIHFESGFGAEEADGQLRRRNVLRRVALGRVQKLVVPSQTLMRIAASGWRIPAARLLRIPNGVDVARFRGEPGRREDGPLPDFRRYGTIIGTAAPLRPEKNVGRLLRAFAALDRSDCALAIAGDGAQLAQLRALAVELKIAERAHFLGHVEDVPAFLRAIDIFALSSDTEQMPNSLLQAMAAARPVAAVDVGDVSHIVTPENRAFVVARDDEGALTAALAELVSDPRRREALGRLNQRHVVAHYSFESMVDAYGKLFRQPQGSSR